MNKATKHTFQGMNQDISKYKYPNNLYYEGSNIRIVSTDTQSTDAITNEKGNDIIVSIPIPDINSSNITYNGIILPYDTDELNSSMESGEQIVIGHTFIRDFIVIFSTDNNGFDCIWKVNDKTYELTLLYVRNMGFSTSNPIQAINNYENKSIDKVYWVDAIHQLRFINIYHSIDNQDNEDLINLSLNSIQSVGTYQISQPKIIDELQGGTHTSGMIQYAYNLFRINGSQTKISPLSELVSLDKGENNGGGEVNEVVGTIPVVKIEDLDPTYTNLRLYSIKYTSFNEQPVVSLVLDMNIVGVTEVTYYDDGNIINTLSLEEFLFLGSDIIIPKHIATKFNRMFLANYKEQNYNVDIDCRAYSFPENTTSVQVYDQITEVANVLTGINGITIDNTYTAPEQHSTININYDINHFQYNSSIIGGEGKYIKYELKRNNIDNKGRFLKDREIYRLGMHFYNNYGQVSLPKWIADFKVITEGAFNNLNEYFASIQITLKPEFYIWLNTTSNFLDENGNYDPNLKPVGYKMLRAERNIRDRTIMCQGLINGMLSQVNGDTTGGDDEPDKITKANNGNKIPSMIRRFDNELNPMWANETYKRVDNFAPDTHPNYADNDPGILGAPLDTGGNEVFKSPSSDGWKFGTYQFNQLMQIYSPEVTFNILQNLGQVDLEVVGGIQNDLNALWGQTRDNATKAIFGETKVNNAISMWDTKTLDPGNYDPITGDLMSHLQIGRYGFFGPRDGNIMEFTQTYRRYTGDMIESIDPTIKNIYGVPEFTEKGQGRTLYNNDNELVYYNHLEILATDTGEGSVGTPNHAITSVNSWGAKTITFALKNTDSDITEDRPTIESLLTDTGIVDTSIGLIGEFKIKNNLIYLGNIYGGNSYEAKRRSNYLEVGEYQVISTNIYNVINIGDTFISNFKFTKLVKTDTEKYDERVQQLTEIVEVRTETTVDLENRNDLSINEWDSEFQPRYDEYQEYNRVYSQESKIIIRRDLDYKFKRIQEFDTNVISTKLKTAGEVIDSWTDLEPNNILTLDGKYGPINCLNNFKDEIYPLQDLAVAILSISPRIQVQGSDGISIQLGAGNVLERYQYLTTESGTKNKWSVVNSPNAFYFYDSLNNTINICKGGVGELSDIKGMHTFLRNKIVYDDIIIDNPILNSGISTGYDYINNELLFTFLQQTENITLSYNEFRQAFVSRYDYFPSRYMSKGDNLIILDPTNTELYKQYEGEYNTFFGIKYSSYITLVVNPEADMDTVFDNIKFKSELYLNDVDQEDKTITHLQLYNEYQDSGLVPLVLGRSTNLRRKFRDWNAILPRNAGTRERIRNPWVFLKLQLNNEDNYKLVLHDIIIAYTI